MKAGRIVLLVAVYTAMAQQAGAALFVVDNMQDDGDWNPGDGVCAYTSTPGNRCTLRAAVQETNALAGADSILLLAGVFLRTVPGVGEDAAATGDLDILDDLEIAGIGKGLTIIDAAGLDRVFEVHHSNTVTIRDLTIRGGAALDSAVWHGSRGGGVAAWGSAVLTIDNCELTSNRAAKGAGINLSIGAYVVVRDSEIHHNRAVAVGTAQVDSPAIEVGGDLILAETLIADNHFDGGVTWWNAAVGNTGNLQVHNSTFSGNHGYAVGSTDYNLSVSNATIVNNGGGVRSSVLSPGISVDIDNSIIGLNTGVDCDVWGSVNISGGRNLDSDGSCGLSAEAGDLPNTNPQLGPLRWAGGPTRSHVPTQVSPIIDVGDGTTCTGDDQRGVPRPQDGDGPSSNICDLGAIEVLPCDTEGMNLLITNTALGNGETAACHHILAGPAVEVQPGAAHTFRVRDGVVLSDGFTVRENATFKVLIDPEAGSSVAIP